MVVKDGDFLKKLLSTFKVEAEEHVQAMSAGLIELEKAATAEEQRKIIETIFRESHSLKGAARAVNAREIEKICQAQESIFAAFKREEIAPAPELLDILLQTVDLLGNLLSVLEAEPTASDKKRITELIRQLHSTLETQAAAPKAQQQSDLAPPGKSDLAQVEGSSKIGGTLSEPQAPEGDSATFQTVLTREEKPARPQTVRISTTKLDTLLLQSEELLSSKLTVRQHVAELGEVGASLAAWKKEWARVQPDLRLIRQSTDEKRELNGQAQPGSKVKRLFEFLDWNSTFLKSLETELTALIKSAEQDQRSLGSMVDHLLEDMKKVLMLPSSSLLEVFPKLVRDISRDRGKELELVMQGGEIEIDRRILEGIKDPLIHLIRNSVDHGIEKPDERAQKKKPLRGTVTLAVTQKGGNEVELCVSDDGAGINLAKVRAVAVKSGLVSQEEVDRLSEQEARELIFRSGISTSPIITDISGRGLGLAIVQEKVEKLGGTLLLESQPDTGVTFRIRLPLTLATFRGILVRVDRHLFVLPTTNVKRVVRVNEEEAKTVENRKTIHFDDQLVALVRLGDVLGLSTRSAADDFAGSAPVVVLGSAEKRIAFLVDEILDEREVLVKSLGKQLARVRNTAGATVLSTGKVAPILNISDLIESAVKTTASPVRASLTAEEEAASRKSILLAEDSITARTLLKNILKSAGYEVKTAVDGADALTELKAGDFDLLVSDIDMPRMNGFDLTAKIREDKRLAELPVVLVTSLDSREDRERGMDVGANAYIVKSSFDQSNLLETVSRMI
ncbi:MAG TPA: hybrid sensor histidine kinase/response regulator [Pyrinomonadaceae bacterium]|nr:hybrid sensor histidine kinase/response regulator [Pyrinomonadaceae bacterium]